MKGPRSWPLASLAVRLKRVNDTIDKLRQLSKRWDNRLVLEDFPLSKHYLDGRIAIALIVDVSKGAGAGRSAFLDNGSICGRDADNHENITGRDCRRILFLILSNPGNDVVRNRYRGDKHPVLIHSVKLIDGVEAPVAPSLVRFYDISDYRREIGCGSLYKSIATGTYEVILRATKREIGDLSNTFRLVFDDFGGDKIKGCSEIVDNIPDNSLQRWLKSVRASKRTHG